MPESVNNDVNVCIEASAYQYFDRHRVLEKCLRAC